MNTAENLGEIEIRPGVTYATHDSVALAGDLYLPRGAGPFPMLIDIIVPAVSSTGQNGCARSPRISTSSSCTPTAKTWFR